LPLHCTKQFCNGPSEFEDLLAGGETEKVLQNSDCAEISEGAPDDINKPGTQEIDRVQVLESAAPSLLRAEQHEPVGEFFAMTRRLLLL
jgi:hypothetical protein